jgi:hypothetical protein
MEQNIDTNQEILVPVLEVANAQLEEYMPSLIKAIDRGCEEHEGTFYIKVMNVHVESEDNKEFTQHRFSFYTQKLCPLPEYDQSVFRYNRSNDQVEFVWTLPDEETARYLIQHREEVVEEEKELLNFVVAFAVGKLRELCNRWNIAQQTIIQQKEPEMVVN